MKRMMIDQGGPEVQPLGLHPEAPGCCPQEPKCRPTGEWILSATEMASIALYAGDGLRDELAKWTEGR